MHLWHERMESREEADGAYWERNMLVLLIANQLNSSTDSIKESDVRNASGIKVNSGWYYDTDNNWKNYGRVISLDNGQYCFHVPDSFDLGTLVEIECNWDGHSTEEKWLAIEDICGAEDKRTINQWCVKYKIGIQGMSHSLFILGPDVRDTMYMTLEEFRDTVIMDSEIVFKPGVNLEEVIQLCNGAKIK